MNPPNELKDIEVEVINPIDSSANDVMAPNYNNDAASEDVSKYQKLRVLIPKLLTTIQKLEILDQNTETNLDLKKSRNRLASIVLDNTKPNKTEIKEFINTLSSALYELGSGIRLLGIEKMIPATKSRALELLTNIVLIQEDIVRLAS